MFHAKTRRREGAKGELNTKTFFSRPSWPALTRGELACGELAEPSNQLVEGASREKILTGMVRGNLSRITVRTTGHTVPS